MRVAQLFVSATLLMSSDAVNAAHDYFSRGWSEHDYDFEVRYRKNVQRILERALQHDVVLRTVHLPPFDPEWIVGVVRASNGYRAFRLEASSFIWGAQESKNKQKLAAIRGIYRDRPITDATALRLAALWRHVLADSRNYGKEDLTRVIRLDTSQFIFTVDHITANTVAWDRGTKAWELVRVSDDIFDFVDGKDSQGEFNSSIRDAERKIDSR
jgi:hypothetical protein